MANDNMSNVDEEQLYYIIDECLIMYIVPITFLEPTCILCRFQLILVFN